MFAPLTLVFATLLCALCITASSAQLVPPEDPETPVPKRKPGPPGFPDGKGKVSVAVSVQDDMHDTHTAVISVSV